MTIHLEPGRTSTPESLATTANAERNRLKISKFRNWRDTRLAPATVERFFGPDQKRTSPGAVRLGTALKILPRSERRPQAAAQAGREKRPWELAKSVSTESLPG